MIKLCSFFKKSILCCLIVFCFSKAYALDTSYSFTPFTETLHGVVQEYSWKDSSSGNLDYMLSELLWDVDMLWTAGFDFLVNINNFEMTAGVAFGLPGESGKMEDSDWLNDVQSQKTHYSEHDNYLRDYRNYDFSFGYVFEPSESWHVKPFLTLTHREFAFDSENGWHDYPTGTYPYTEVGSGVDRNIGPSSGAAVSYEQYMQYLSLGAEVAYIFEQSSEISLDISFLPLVISTARDDHWKRDLEIIEAMFGGYGFSGNLKGVFRLGKHISLNAGIGGTYITNLKGYAFTRSSENLASNVSESLFNSLESKYTNPILFFPHIWSLWRDGKISNFYMGAGAGQMFVSVELSTTFSW